MNESEAPAPPMPSFKTCGSCGQEWADWREFLFDPYLRPIGLQAITHLPDANLIMFEHRCGSSLSIPANRLRDLLPGVEEEAGRPLLFGREKCEGHCRTIEDLKICQQPCINSRDRRLVLLLVEMKQYRD